MKILSLSLLFLISTSAFAQDAYSYYPWYKQLYSVGNYQAKTCIDSTFNAKGMYKSREFTEYNSKGMITLEENSLTQRNYHYQLFNDSTYKSCVVLKKGDTVSFWINTFNQFGKPIVYQYGRKSRSKILYTDSSFYDSQQRKTKLTRYNKKAKLRSYVAYSYNEEGKRAEVKTYDKKGKLKYLYSYNCNEKGEPIKDIKQVNICKSSGTHADGRYFDLIETRNEKGQLKREVFTYSKDSLLIEREFTKMNGKPNGRQVFDWDKLRHLKSITYFNAKNKLNYSYEYVVNDKGYRTSWKGFNSKRKLVSFVKSDFTWYD